MQSPPVDIPSKPPAAEPAKAGEAGAAFETLLHDDGGVAAAEAVGVTQSEARRAPDSTATEPTPGDGPAKAKPAKELLASAQQAAETGRAVRAGLGLRLTSALAATPHTGRMLGLPIAAAHGGLAADAVGRQQAPRAQQAQQAPQPQQAPQQAAAASAHAMGRPHIGSDGGEAATSTKGAARAKVPALRIADGQTDARFSAQRVSVTVAAAGLKAHRGGTLDGATSLAAASASDLADGKAPPAGGNNRAQAARNGPLADAAKADEAGEQSSDKPPRNASRGLRPEGARGHAAISNTGGRQGNASQRSAAASVPKQAAAAEASTTRHLSLKATAASAELADRGRPAGDRSQHASATGGSETSAAAARSAGHVGTGARPAAPPSPVAEQVAVHIQRAVGAGQHRVSIQMHPPELGRIDVRLHVADDGSVRAAVTADKPDTLELLQRDARGLERALSDAGLKTQSGGLDFGLRGHGGHGQPGGRSAADLPPATDDGEASASTPDEPVEPRSAPQGTSEGIDIRV